MPQTSKQDAVYFHKRKGYIRLAIEAGRDILPVYHLGQSQVIKRHAYKDPSLPASALLLAHAHARMRNDKIIPVHQDLTLMSRLLHTKDTFGVYQVVPGGPRGGGGGGGGGTSAMNCQPCACTCILLV